MTRALRMTLFVIMIAGFAFGFAGLILPGQTALLMAPLPGDYQFQRLHIFLFNLVAGGAVLLWFTEGKRRLAPRVTVYMVLSLGFSLAVFMNRYGIAVMLAVALAFIVESLRIERFRFFPTDFFKWTTSLAERYLHAALLCLSLGLLISAGVMLNNQYLHWFDFLNLLLDDFFLGFSFPLSLLTFAVMFALMKEPDGKIDRLLRESSFWIVTLGVIIFFVFIILDVVSGQLVMALVLLGDVLLLYYLFRRDSKELEEVDFLTSGMAFLIFTGFTGVLILLWRAVYSQTHTEGWNMLFQIHAYLSLYGWNLSGLAVVVRHDEFPLRLHDVEIILLHWATVALLAPLGTIYGPFALLALPAFVVLLAMFLFSKGHAHVASRKWNQARMTGPFWRDLG